MESPHIFTEKWVGIAPVLCVSPSLGLSSSMENWLLLALSLLGGLKHFNVVESHYNEACPGLVNKLHKLNKSGQVFLPRADENICLLIESCPRVLCYLTWPLYVCVTIESGGCLHFCLEPWLPRHGRKEFLPWHSSEDSVLSHWHQSWSRCSSVNCHGALGG